MRSTPLILYVAMWVQWLPAVGLLSPRVRAIGGRVWIIGALLVSFGGDIVQYFMGKQRINNLWVGYVATALYGLVVIQALRAWQTTSGAAQTLRIGMVLYIALCSLAPWIENVQQFSVVVIPAQYIFIFVLCVATLIRNSLQDRLEPLTRYDWFWICAGLALSFGGSSAIQPMANVFMARNQLDGAVALWVFRAWIQLVALLLITTGVLWARSTVPSSLSLSPAR